MCIYIYNAYFKTYEHQKTKKLETSWKPLNKSRNNHGNMQENHEKVYENHAIINENERKPCKHQQNTMQRGIATSETYEITEKLRNIQKYQVEPWKSWLKAHVWETGCNRNGETLKPPKLAGRNGESAKGYTNDGHTYARVWCFWIFWKSFLKVIFFLKLLLFIFGCKQF